MEGDVLTLSSATVYPSRHRLPLPGLAQEHASWSLGSHFTLFYPLSHSPHLPSQVIFSHRIMVILYKANHITLLSSACQQSKSFPWLTRPCLPGPSHLSGLLSQLRLLASSTLASLQLDPHLPQSLYTCPSLCLGSSSLNCLFLNITRVFAQMFSSSQQKCLLLKNSIH